MLEHVGIKSTGKIQRNLDIDTLIKKSVARKEGIISKSGALSVFTGKYTGRSPNDRYIVDSPSIHDKINWGKTNIPLSENQFNDLYGKIARHMAERDEIFVFDGIAGADPAHSMNVRVVNELASHNLSIRHMLRKVDDKKLKKFMPDFTIICAPDCKADPVQHKVNSEAFIILNLEKRIAIIGGSRYFGEIKKAIFSVMNYFLPEKGVLSLHCSANADDNGNVALFLGLSGTGKTSLSTDKDRRLIGDDEHAWSKNGIFNIEGGCYAKCINLSEKKEPGIYNAIRHGAIVENVVMDPITLEFDFSKETHTENTRVTYPIEHLDNAVLEGIGGHPNTIVFLTADAFGVLPPVAKLTKEQAIYHFLSGYTSKLAGTERGIITPVAAFSMFFGEPFMPLKPNVYASLMEKYLTDYGAEVYLVNTGWVGGPYGVGKRIDIAHSRAIVNAAVNGQLKARDKDKNDGKGVDFVHDDIFNLEVPKTCPGVDSSILNPRESWTDKDAYDKKAKELAALFQKNISKFSDIREEVINSGPR